MAATTLVYGTPVGHRRSPRSPVEATPVLPGASRLRSREVVSRDAVSLVALALAGAALMLAVGGSDDVLSKLRALATVCAVVLLPLAMTASAVYTAVAAAERRTPVDDRPAPARSIRRHALLWAGLTGAVLAPVAGVLLGWSRGVLVASTTMVVVVLGAEIGIVVGRDRPRSLQVLSSTFTVAALLALLLARGTGPGETAAVAVAAGAAITVLVSRLLCRDTRPGVPVWTRHHAGWSTALANASVLVLVTAIPLGLAVTTNDPTVPLLVFVTATPLAVSAMMAGPALVACASAVQADVRAVAPRVAVVLATSSFLAILALASGRGTLMAGVLVGLVAGTASFLGRYLVAQGDSRFPANAVGAVIALAGGFAGSVLLLAAGASLAAVGTAVRLRSFRRPEPTRREPEGLPQLSTDPFGSRLPLWSPRAAVDVSIVVPFLNPDAESLVHHLDRIRDGLTEGGHSFEIIAVDDGSTNGAAARLERLPWRGLRVIRHSQNRGKGGALATGFVHGRGRLIGFIDADGDIDAHHLAGYVEAACDCDADVVLADKTHPGSRNGSAADRQLTSRVMHLINRRLLRLDVVDTQTGAKLYRRALVQTALPRMWENGFAFDVEMFVLAQHLGFDRLVHMPVEIERDGSSTVSLRATLRTGLRVMGILRRMLLADYFYGPGTPALQSRRSGERGVDERHVPSTSPAAEADPGAGGHRVRAVGRGS